MNTCRDVELTTSISCPTVWISGSIVSSLSCTNKYSYRVCRALFSCRWAIVQLTVYAFVNFLNSDRAGQCRTYFFQYASTCMPGCQRCPCDRTRARTKRYTNSFVMVDAVPAQYSPNTSMKECQR